MRVLQIIEVYEPYINQLQQEGFKVIRANIEKDKLPLDDASVEVVIANQISGTHQRSFLDFSRDQSGVIR